MFLAIGLGQSSKPEVGWRLIVRQQLLLLHSRRGMGRGRVVVGMALVQQVDSELWLFVSWYIQTEQSTVVPAMRLVTVGVFLSQTCQFVALFLCMCVPTTRVLY